MSQPRVHQIIEPLSDRLRARWRGPRSLTAVVPIEGTDAGALHARLTRLAPRILEAVARIDELHSFRLCAIPPDTNLGRGVCLLVNAVHDGPMPEFLEHLVHDSGQLLCEALAGASFSGDAVNLPQLLCAHRVREQTVHLGAINKSVKDIRGELRLREAVEDYIDEQLARRVWNASTPAETVRRETRQYICSQFAGTDMPCGASHDLTPFARLLRCVDLLVTFAFPAIGVLGQDIRAAIERIPDPVQRSAKSFAYALWWIYGAIPTGLAFLGVRVLELIEPDNVAPPPDQDNLDGLEAGEDLRPNNEVTVWFPVRPTFIRRTLLCVILWGSDRGCRHFWTDGRLAGIETIHYARIMQVDGGRNMLFMSDYDGGLNRYLNDFLGVGSRAVIAISSSLDGCPKTRWLFEQADPSTFGPRWRGLIRRYQLETAVWYSAYPLMTVTEILANAQLRNGLFAAELTEEEARRWARRL